MKPIKFKSTTNDEELIIVCKSIFRIGEVKAMYWGDNSVDGQVYEYRYDVIVNGEFSCLDEYELNEALEGMKFVEGE